MKRRSPRARTLMACTKGSEWLAPPRRVHIANPTASGWQGERRQCESCCESGVTRASSSSDELAPTKPCIECCVMPSSCEAAAVSHGRVPDTGRPISAGAVCLMGPITLAEPNPSSACAMPTSIRPSPGLELMVELMVELSSSESAGAKPPPPPLPKPAALSSAERGACENTGSSDGSLESDGSEFDAHRSGKLTSLKADSSRKAASPGIVNADPLPGTYEERDKER